MEKNSARKNTNRIGGYYGTTTEYNHYIYDNGAWNSTYTTNTTKDTITVNPNAAKSKIESTGIYLYEHLAQTDTATNLEDATGGMNKNNTINLQDLYIVNYVWQKVSEDGNKAEDYELKIIDEIYPVGTIYMLKEIFSSEEMEDKFGGKWELYSEGRKLVGEGSNEEESFEIGTVGGNLEVENIDISHKHEYTKLFPHTHTYGFQWAGWYGISTEFGKYLYNLGQWKNTYKSLETVTGYHNSGSSAENAEGTCSVYRQIAETGTVEQIDDYTIENKDTVNGMEEYETAYIWKKVEEIEWGLNTKEENTKNELLEKVYPVGSIYMTDTLSTEEQVAEALGGKWQKYSQGRTIIGQGANEENTYANGETGGNLNVAEVSIEHTRDYYNIFQHSHQYGIRWGGWYGSSAEMDSRWIYDNGTWKNTSTTISKDLTVNSNANFIKEKVSVGTMQTYEITANTAEANSQEIQTSPMTENQTINGQDPYTVVYMWKKIE